MLNDHDEASDFIARVEVYLRMLGESLKGPDFNGQDVDDAVQLTRLTAYDYYHTGRQHEIRNLELWLKTVARRKKLGILRSRRRYTPFNDNTFDADSVKALKEMQRNETISVAISALPKQHQRLVDLRYFERKKPREVARELGISRRTFEIRHKQALCLLRKILENLM